MADSIKFADENAWTAEFDWGLILGGSYEYSFNGTDLKLWKPNFKDPVYFYDLKKQ